jgi:metal-responsive CopG/Arc/MetJ family transcriptional regulator
MAKVKLQITMDENLLAELDDYCDKNYMNRSWTISQAVVQLVNQQKMVDSIVNMSMAMKKAAEQGSIDDETRKEMESFETLCKMFLGK